MLRAFGGGTRSRSPHGCSAEAGSSTSLLPRRCLPPLEIEYSKPKAWVRVTFGGEVFEASHPMLKDGPLAWGGAGKNYDWDVNVVAGSGMRGWSWFKLADDRLDWKGFCEIAP